MVMCNRNSRWHILLLLVLPLLILCLFLSSWEELIPLLRFLIHHTLSRGSRLDVSRHSPCKEKKFLTVCSTLSVCDWMESLGLHHSGTQIWKSWVWGYGRSKLLWGGMTLLCWVHTHQEATCGGSGFVHSTLSMVQHKFEEVSTYYL